MNVLVLNAGSSSLKLAAGKLPPESQAAEITWSKTIAMSLADAPDKEVEQTLQEGPPVENIEAVGHRVVHGGTRLTSSRIIDASVEAQLDELCQLAPLHNPIGLKVIRAAKRIYPNAKHFAVFDTAFHSSMPLSSKIYGVPYDWFANRGIMRFGFHGISHQYCSVRTAAILGKALSNLKTVTCHLGNGCSLAAVSGGTSIDTTMGFTPLDGLLMGSRSGSVDPGIVLHLARTGLTIDEIDHALNKASGLAGLSGLGKDMREIVAALEAGNERAALAYEVFINRLVKGIAAMAASMEGVHAIAFTGGIGENSQRVRQDTCKRLAFFGVKLDNELNYATRQDADISKGDSAIKIVVVHAKEELAILGEWAKLKGAMCPGRG